MLDYHLGHNLTPKGYRQLAENKPGTTADYWQGYHEGVTYGYKAALGEEK